MSYNHTSYSLFCNRPYIVTYLTGYGFTHNYNKKMNPGALDPTKALLLVIYNFLMADLSSCIVGLHGPEICAYNCGLTSSRFLFLGFFALHASYANPFSGCGLRSPPLYIIVMINLNPNNSNKLTQINRKQL